MFRAIVIQGERNNESFMSDVGVFGASPEHFLDTY